MFDLEKNIEEEDFEKNILPFFNDIRFQYLEPFVLEPETTESNEDYNYIFNSLFHGSLYRIISHIKGVNLLYSEYLDAFKRNVVEYKVFGERVFTYLNTPILILKSNIDNNNNFVEIIEPIYKPLIIQDTEELISIGVISEKKSFEDYKNNNLKEDLNYENLINSEENDKEDEFNLDDI